MNREINIPRFIVVLLFLANAIVHMTTVRFPQYTDAVVVTGIASYVLSRYATDDPYERTWWGIIAAFTLLSTDTCGYRLINLALIAVVASIYYYNSRVLARRRRKTATTPEESYKKRPGTYTPQDTYRPRKNKKQPVFYTYSGGEFDVNQKIYGEAGEHIGSSDFGDRAKAGAYGEVMLGNILNSFAMSHPHTYVFHSVTFNPGHEGPDVDHVLVCGDRIFLIDAKNWKQDNYYGGLMGKYMRGEEGEFSGGEVKMKEASDLWKRYILTRDGSTDTIRNITPVIVVTQRPKGYDIKLDGMAEVQLMTTRDFGEKILAQLESHDINEPDMNVLRAIHSQLQ